MFPPSSHPRQPSPQPMCFLTPQSPDKPPMTIIFGKYELGRLLGSGGFAKVYVARSIETDQLVAVKIIDKKRTDKAGVEPMIIREIEAMRRLQHHPNVLKIHEVMATKTKIYLVMELAAGGDIFTKILRAGRLQEPEARRYFQQLVSALTFCHREGISHRDVKPQNILLDKDGNIKVTDFGLSALPENRNSTGMLNTACGTPAYAAPEVIAQRAYDGVRADSWSCGVFLFFLLAAYTPFDDSHFVIMYRKIQGRDYKFPSWFSKQARSIIYRLLDPNPATRMSLEVVSKTKWFKKGLETSEVKYSAVLESDDGLGKLTSGTITAFDLISLSTAWDLSGLFERRKRKMTRFTARVSAEGVVEKARKIGEKLGFRVDGKSEARVVGLSKGRMTVVLEAVELVEGLVVAEMKVVEVVEEEDESHWSEIIVELEEIVFAWHNEAPYSDVSKNVGI